MYRAPGMKGTGKSASHLVFIRSLDYLKYKTFELK
jgi:hypothetical protein